MSRQVSFLSQVGVVDGVGIVGIDARTGSDGSPILGSLSVHTAVLHIVSLQVVQVGFHRTEDDTSRRGLRLSGMNLSVIICQAFADAVSGLVYCLCFSTNNVRLRKGFEGAVFRVLGRQHVILAQQKELQARVSVSLHVHDALVSLIVGRLVVRQTVFHHEAVHKALQHTVVATAIDIGGRTV